MHEQKTEISACLTVLFAFSTLTVYARYDLGFQWPNVPSTILWYCGELTASQRQAAQAAMNTWNTVHASSGSELLTSIITSDSSTTYNWIFFDNLDPGVVARTFPSPETGYVESVTIRMSNDYAFSIGASSNAYDFQSVILHELGHAYGIAHCHEVGNDCGVIGCPNNVMSPTLSVNTLRRSLQTYDIINYQYIYVS